MKEKNRKTFHIISISLGLLALFGLLTTSLPKPLLGLRINTSSSVPHYLFLKTASKNYSRNTYVSLNHPYSKMLLVKKIIGLPGDPIQIIENRIFVCGNDCGILKEKSPSGLLLTPIRIGAIPKDHYYVYAPHENSFDSRYAEFGLVHIKNIKEVLCPLF